jgi:hypothetical protein
MSHDPSDVFAQFYIDGEWRDTYDGEDLSARVRSGDSIRITRGGSDQFSSITSQSASFTLNNRDNLFTDDDPSSPLYRKFGVHTRCRFGVRHPTRDLDLYLLQNEIAIENGGRTYTADKASLDITGDIDVRWEMDMRWTRDRGQLIGGKYTLTGNQRSWVVYARSDGRLSVRTSVDGTNATLSIHSTTAQIIDEVEGRCAYRLTIDVDDGAGNRVYTWYTSDSISGTWTQVEQNTVAGAISLFSGTAALSVGAANEGQPTIADFGPLAGKLYAFQVRDGIGGTLVADFNPNDSDGVGSTTWADTCASPNTWTIDVSGTGVLPFIRVGSDRLRFTGEVTSRPDDWDGTGTDRYCVMTAQGILSHYASNRAPLQSVERRYWTRQSGIVGYWPCEDASGATQVSSALDAGTPGLVNDVSFGSASEGFGGTTGAITLNQAAASTADFYATTHSGTGAWGFVFYFRMEQVPASDQVLVNIYPTGSNVVRWAFQVGLTGYRWTAYSSSGAILANSATNFGAGANPQDGWVGMSMTFKQESGNIRYETSWHGVGTSSTYTHSAGGTTFAGTVGTVRRMYFVPTDANFDNCEIAHVVMMNFEYEINSDEFEAISRGFAGETFGTRWRRLLAEEGIPYEWVGDLDDTEECGVQPADSLYSILGEGAKLDGGLICEARDRIGLRYITAKALGNRKRLELSYSSSHLTETPRPTPDRSVVNDFTASRDDGGSARYEATDNRRRNVREPDDPTSPGVGRFERSDSYNAYEDARMMDIASFRVFLGTWDERVIPTMVVSTHRTEISSNTGLLSAIYSQDIGDPIAIVDTTGASCPLPPNDARSMSTGYVEQIRNMTHDINFNTVPNGPYQVPIIESENGEYIPMLDVDGNETTLDGALDTTSTTIDFKTLKTATAPIWVDDTNYPDDIGGGITFDVDINGERVTFTSITAPTSDATYNYQTATAVRSVNSVVKSHDDGTVIKLFRPSYLGKI